MIEDIFKPEHYCHDWKEGRMRGDRELCEAQCLFLAAILGAVMWAVIEVVFA